MITSGSDTTDDNNVQSSWTAAPPLPTDLSVTIHHHGASPAQKRRRLEARQGATIHGRELVQGAPLIPDRVKETSGDDKMSSSTMDDNPCQSLTAALPLPTDLSFTIHHHGASPEPGRRHGQPRHRSEARRATIRGREMVQGAPVIIPDHVEGTSGAAPATSDVPGPRLIAVPQQQAAFMPQCFTFSCRSPPNAEPEQQAMDCYKPSQHDDLANAFSCVFDGLSLGNDHPGPSATAVEAASSDTGSSSCQEGGGRQEQQ